MPQLLLGQHRKCNDPHHPHVSTESTTRSGLRESRLELNSGDSHNLPHSTVDLRGPTPMDCPSPNSTHTHNNEWTNDALRAERCRSPRGANYVTHFGESPTSSSINRKGGDCHERYTAPANPELQDIDRHLPCPSSQQSFIPSSADPTKLKHSTLKDVHPRSCPNDHHA
ncbi:hypothetical protein FCV25MIE_08412 [Fagus crenata]